ncbi:hypothetical protein SAMN04490190_0848 [Pseudomonas libanensis]|nr:hypothetical protein SAMN04490190_0848 [Pseudomonas libanensis]
MSVATLASRCDRLDCRAQGGFGDYLKSLMQVS